MPNDPISPAYRVVSERLEKLLSPRVASRTLHLGLKQVGRSPVDADADHLDPVLKGPVFKQLQVAMPADRARAAVQEILRAMRDAETAAASPSETPPPPRFDPEPPAAPEPDADVGPPAEPESAPRADARPEAAPAEDPDDGSGVETEDGARAVADLRAAMQPYNLYFEWPEVRALRAQLQRLQAAVEAGETVAGLVEEAYAQLDAVAAKHEERLADQARDLDELEGMLAALDGAGDVRVRRLEAHVKRLREAQASRQIAEAEIERALRLASSLRERAEEAAAGGPDGEGTVPSPDRPPTRAAGAPERGAAPGAGPAIRDVPASGPAAEPPPAADARLEAADLAEPTDAPSSPEARLAAARAALREAARTNSAGVADVRRRLARLDGPDRPDAEAADRELEAAEARLATLREEARLASRVAARLLEEDRLGRLLDAAGDAAGGPGPDRPARPAGSPGTDDPSAATAPSADAEETLRPEVTVRLVGEEATRDYARRLAERIPPRTLLLLEGPLGAGKTTLVAALARALGSDARVSSPTYTLVHEYPTPEGVLVHVDAYRLEDVEELEAMGLDEYLDRARLVAVEWGAPLAEARPEAWRLRLERPEGDPEERIARLVPGSA